MGGVQRDLDVDRVQHPPTGRDHRRLTSGVDRGTGVFGTAFAFTVVMVFLLFAVQLLFGLYARTMVTAIGADVAAEAAVAVGRGGDLRTFEADALARLGSYGDEASVDVTLLDTDGDGRSDTVAVTIQAALPTLLPSQWIPGGAGTVSRTMRARVEQFQTSNPIEPG